MPKTPFVDFRAVRARITIEQVLDHYALLGQLKRTGNRLTGTCPVHQGSNPTQFRVDTEKNLWNCFGDCKGGGNVLDFIAKKEGIPVHEAAVAACEWFSIPLNEVKGGEGREGPKRTEKHSPTAEAAMPLSPTMPSGSPNPPLKFRLDKLDRIHPYFEQRGLTLETVVDFGLGYFTGEKGLMVGRIAIPIDNVRGELVAYAGRWPGETPEGQPKYKLPPGFRKGQELFNLDRAIRESDDKPLVLVEGFFDAILLHQHGCRRVAALMGSILSEAQEELIRTHTRSASRVLVMLDEDDAGKAARDDIARRLARFCYVRVHQFDESGTQPEHLTAEQVSDLIG